LPGTTYITFGPRDEICSVMKLFSPETSPTKTITDMTPMTIPKIVNDERIRLRSIDDMAKLNVSN
jgi:hypothetical protein